MKNRFCFLLALSFIATVSMSSICGTTAESEFTNSFILGFKLQDNHVVSSEIAPITQSTLEAFNDLQFSSEQADSLLFQITVNPENNTVVMIPLSNQNDFTFQQNVIKYLINNDSETLSTVNFEEGAHLQPILTETLKILGDQVSFLVGVKLLILTQGVKLVRRIGYLGAQILVFTGVNLHNYILEPGYSHIVLPVRDFAVDCLDANFFAQQ